MFFAIVPTNYARAHECLDDAPVHSQLKSVVFLSLQKEFGKAGMHGRGDV